MHTPREALNQQITAVDAMAEMAHAEELDAVDQYERLRCRRQVAGLDQLIVRLRAALVPA